MHEPLLNGATSRGSLDHPRARRRPALSSYCEEYSGSCDGGADAACSDGDSLPSGDEEAPPIIHEVEYGGVDHAGVDFDYCFVFVLPGHAEVLEEEARNREDGDPVAQTVSEVAKVATLRDEREERQFRKRIWSLEESRKSAYSSRRKTRPLSHAPTVQWTQHIRFFTRGSRHPLPQEEVETLFKNMFYRAEDRENFELPQNVNNLRETRRACIDLFLNFFRRDEEKYHTYIFTSVDRDELFICVKMVEETALQHADVSEYAFQLDFEALQSELDIILYPGPEGPNGAAMCPAYVKYDRIMDPILRKHPCEAEPNRKSILRKIDNIRLLYDRVTDVLNVDAMKTWGLLVDYFPLHTRSRLEYFTEEWGNMRKWYSFEQDIEAIRLYFGEQVALYFLFLGELCRAMKWLVFVAVLVCCCNFHSFILAGQGDFFAILGGSVGEQREVELLRISLAAFQIIWMQVFGLSLRQHIRMKLNVWGNDVDNISSVKALENSRYAANAYVMPSELDANIQDTMVPVTKVVRGRAWSKIVSATFTAFTLFAVACIFALKAYLLKNGHVGWSNVASYGVTIQIKLFNFMWGRLSAYCVDCEHHKTELDYYNALANKMYMFDFINSFCSFYYIAFFMEKVEGECPPLYGSCWGYLTYQMIVVYSIYMFFTLYDIFYPLWVIRSATNEEVTKLKKLGKLSEDDDSPGYSFIEQQAKMSTYDGQGMIDDYLGIIGPLGFVLLFGITMPMCSLLALVCFGLQLRADAWKLTRAIRRPFPMIATLGLGVWQVILEQLVHLSVITNVALVCFQVQPFKDWPLTSRFLLFFALSNALGGMEILLAKVWPVESAEVNLAKRRHYHQREKALRYGQSGMPNVDKLSLVGRANTFYRDLPGLHRRSQYFEPPLVT
eukprot:TRINITY_DN25559_c0_g1_i1.p1 TRINITY_DN25559_c0_g1~~TRINITY_DN25559_c0_g1_i1.p1  ORF type:complete len:895 (-),score=184.58 TRINITY_DN25559_c0_g1_i1:164-2848(-)